MAATSDGASAQEGEGWRNVARLSDLPESGLLDVTVGRHVVLLVRQGEQLRAFQGLCPHQYARLADGVLHGDELQCPHHMARFRLSDGVCTGGWALAPLRRFAVRTSGDAIQLADPLKPL